MDNEIYFEDLQEIADMVFLKNKIIEAKQPHYSAQDARDKLERARDEANRALEELRRVQGEYDANQRIGSEIKSAMGAVIDVEKSILNAIHRIENVIHRINKISSSPATANESIENKHFIKEDMEIEIPFKYKGQELVALFDVEAVVRKVDGRPQLEENPKIRLLSITEKEDPSKEVEPKLSVQEMQELQDEALKKYVEEFNQQVA